MSIILLLHEQIFYIIRQVGLWNMYEKIYQHQHIVNAYKILKSV